MNRDYGDDIHLLPLVMTRLHMTTGGCEVIVRDGMQSLSCRWWKLKAIELPRWLCWSSQCTAQSLISTSVQSLINTSAESLIGTSTGASSAHLQEPHQHICLDLHQHVCPEPRQRITQKRSPPPSNILGEVEHTDRRSAIANLVNYSARLYRPC